MVLDLTGRAVSSGQNKVILRNIFVAVRRILSPHHVRKSIVVCTNRLLLLQSNFIPDIPLAGPTGCVRPSPHSPAWACPRSTCWISCLSSRKKWRPPISYRRASSFRPLGFILASRKSLTPSFVCRAQMQATLASAVPMVVQAISNCIKTPVTQRSPHELTSALKCLQAWMSVLPAKYVSLRSPMDFTHSPGHV